MSQTITMTHNYDLALAGYLSARATVGLPNNHVSLTGSFMTFNISFLMELLDELA